MSNGASKYLESLNPIANYSFDKIDTITVDDQYYFINKTPYEFPFLIPRTTSADYYIDNDDPTSYSLSLVEKTRSYRSFKSGINRAYKYNSISYIRNSNWIVDQIPEYERRQTTNVFNSASRLIKVDMDDVVYNSIGDEYTIMFQMKVSDQGGIQSLGSLHREDNVDLDFNGFPIDKSFPPYVMANNNTPLNFRQRKKCVSFRILDVALILEFVSETTARMSIMSNDGRIYDSYGMTVDRVYCFAFCVSNFQTILRVDNLETTIRYDSEKFTDIERKTIQLGFETTYDETPTPITFDSGITYLDSGDLYKLYSSRYNAMFDNIAIFNRTLTTAEIRRYQSLNVDVKTLYRNAGITELYDFAHLYDAESTDHLQSNYMVKSILNNVHNSLRASSDDPYNGFATIRYPSGNIEYALSFSKRSMLYDDSHYWYNYQVEYRLIKSSTFSLAFSFKTTDTNGLLYSYSRNTPDSRNFMLMFKDGILQIWKGFDVVSELTGYNNGEFHNIIINNVGTQELKIYINSVLVHTNTGIYDSSPMKCSNFGNGLPHITGLKFELALLGYGNRLISDLYIFDLYSNVVMYEASGIITLNNIRVGTTVLIYDNYSGKLLERLKSNAADGVFVYSNRYPFIITVVVNDDAMLNGRSYIVSPVEMT